MVSTASLK